MINDWCKEEWISLIPEKNLLVHSDSLATSRCLAILLPLTDAERSIRSAVELLFNPLWSIENSTTVHTSNWKPCFSRGVYDYQGQGEAAKEEDTTQISGGKGSIIIICVVAVMCV